MSTLSGESDLVDRIQHMDRHQCIKQLRGFKRIPLDFTRESLERMSLDKLRHVLFAAYHVAGRRA